MARPRIHLNQIQLTVRIDEDIADRLETIADKLGISRSDLLRAVLEYCVEAIEEGGMEVTAERTSLVGAKR